RARTAASRWRWMPPRRTGSSYRGRPLPPSPTGGEGRARGPVGAPVARGGRLGSVPVEPRPAASVILVRPGGATSLQCYLIRRAPTMRFLGGYHAFPGGKVDLADWRPEALAGVYGLAPGDAAARLGDPDDAVPALAYWATGVRELFEETGLLLAVHADGRAVETGTPTVAARLEAHRRALVAGERSFTAILAEEGWLADARPLAYLSVFVTPPSSPIRYSARFF